MNKSDSALFYSYKLLSDKKKDLQQRVSKYEAWLRAFQYDEETIKNMINDKIRFNDGKDLFKQVAQLDLDF